MSLGKEGSTGMPEGAGCPAPSCQHVSADGGRLIGRPLLSPATQCGETEQRRAEQCERAGLGYSHRRTSADGLVVPAKRTHLKNIGIADRLLDAFADKRVVRIRPEVDPIAAVRDIREGPSARVGRISIV